MSLVEIEESKTKDGFLGLHLYLNNPGAKNAMTWDMGLEFEQIVHSYLKNKIPPRYVILSGRGDAFSAGGDLNLLKSFSKKSYEDNYKDMQRFYGFFLSIRKFTCPVIGAIHGHAVGAGFSLAIATDFRIFAKEGKYGFNFVRLGIHPGMGSSYITGELFGKNLALELLLGANLIDGETAFQKGICSEAVPKSHVGEHAQRWAEDLSDLAPLAVSLLKKTLYKEDELQKALEREAKCQAENFIHPDFLETICSIEDKRKPIFYGNLQRP